MTLLFLTIIADILMYVLGRKSIPNLFIGNIFLLAQFLILMSIFYDALKKKHKKLILMVSIAAITLKIYGSIIGLSDHNSLLSTFTSISALIVCMLYFYRTLQDLPTMEIHKDPTIWIVIAALVYYSGTIFLFIVSNYFLKFDVSMHAVLWAFHNVLNIVKNILFATALWRSLLNRI